MLLWRKRSGAMAGMWVLGIAFFMLALLAGQAQATKSGLVLSARAVDPAKDDGPASVALGETIWVPVVIKSRLPWKSMKVKLAYDVKDSWSTGKAADIEIGEVTLDATQQAPQTVRVPVRVKGEGMFVLKGVASMKAEDENAVVNGVKGGFDYPLTAGVFAFEGRVFVGSSISMAMHHMARANVEKTAAYQTLLKNKDQQAADRMEKQEFDRFWETFKHLRPIPPQPKADPKAYVPANIRRGDAVTIRLNWAADSAASRFLPVKGADIGIFDASSGAQVSAGVVSNGTYTFTAPRDGFSFRGEVFTKHGSEFGVRDPRASGQPLFRVEFSNMDEVDIYHTNPGLNTDVETMRAFSVFHAMVDVHERVRAELNISKQSGYSVMFPDAGTYFRPSAGTLHLVLGDAYDWDVIAHEFSHALDHENSVIRNGQGGGHSFLINQYDYPQVDNPATYQNKDRSLALAISEAYATWLGVALLENSPYKGLVANVGDGIYNDTEDQSTADNMEANTTAVRGEDAEAALYKLLWDLSDAAGDANAVAICADACADLVSLPLRRMHQQTFAGQGIANISDYYAKVYRTFAGVNVGEVETGPTTAVVDATHALGAVFAEFGVAAHLNEADNANALRDLDQKPPVAPTLKWNQHKTGSMPGLDEFELIFLSGAGDAKLHQLTPSATVSQSNAQFSVTLTQAETDDLIAALAPASGAKTRLLVKAKASGQNVADGAIATGPYYSNAILLDVPDLSKLAVIAVDSSGSNAWTDPQNLRIGAAQKMLQSMGRRNAEIAAGTAPYSDELPTVVAALDFDDRVRELSDFAPAQDLAARNAFSAIDSVGGTDIAGAIHYATRKINPSGTHGGAAKPFPNTAKTYVLTDMDNNAGPRPVVAAIQQSGAAGIPVNMGHLVPLRTQNAQFAPEDLRGEPAIGPKAAEPMDPIAEALLASGGSYAIIENAQAQDAWVALMNELNNTDPATRTELNLPPDVKLYGMAVADDGRTEPTYVFTATKAGPATVTVDGKGNFVPAISVNGAGAQTALGQDLYEVRFDAQVGTAYRILVNEAASAAGLYSIVVRQQQNAVKQKAVLVPAGGPAAVVLMGMLLMLGAGWAHQQSRCRRA